MTGDVVPVSEIYQDLTPAQIKRVQQATKEIHVGSRIASRSIMAIGQRLAEIKAILTVNGQWRKWLVEEFDESHDTADRLIRVAEKFPKNDVTARFAKSALYLLSENDVPQAARDLAIERAEKGEKITRKIAAHIADKFQKAAARVVEQAIVTQGAVTLNGASVSVLDSVTTIQDEEGKEVQVGTLSQPVINAAIAQEAAEIIKYDTESVIRHIGQRNANLGKTEFLRWGTLSDFSALMKSGVTQRFDGEIRISVYGIKQETEDE